MDRTSSLSLLSIFVCFLVTLYALSKASDHLTDKEKLSIRTTNDLFKGNLKDNMVVFYQTLFTDHPQYHQNLEALRNVKTSEFGNNEFIRDKQGPKTGLAIVDLVAKMDDTDELRKSVRSMLNSHASMVVGLDHCKNAFDALLKTYSKQLGSKWTDGDVEAWKKFIDIVLQLIEEELKKN